MSFTAHFADSTWIQREILQGRSLFGGRKPGGAWRKLSLVEIDNHLEYDADAQLKPPTFFPLFRQSSDYTDLLGVRVVPGNLILCHWSRSRGSLVDISPIIKDDNWAHLESMKVVSDFVRGIYRQMSQSRNDPRKPHSSMTLFVEPLSSGSLDVSIITFGKFVISTPEADRRVSDSLKEDPWNASEWLRLCSDFDYFTMKKSDVTLFVQYFENAYYSAVCSSSAHHWLVQYFNLLRYLEYDYSPVIDRYFGKVDELMLMYRVIDYSIGLQCRFCVSRARLYRNDMSSESDKDEFNSAVSMITSSTPAEIVSKIEHQFGFPIRVIK